MDGLRHVLMVRVLHVFKLCSWCSLPAPLSLCSRNLNVECFPVASLESIRLFGFGLSGQVSLYWSDFLVLHRHSPHRPHISNPVEDFPSRSTGCVTPDSWVSPSPESLASVSPSVNLHWESLLDMALCFPIGSERKLLEWLQENIEKLMMLNKRRRRFHASRVKLPLVSMSASWFSVSTYLIRIFGSELSLTNHQSSATLWVLDTCLILLDFVL